MLEIGAGGGSLARVDALGLLRVGPESAAAVPGPACYDRGGDRPTVTDADLVLGYLNPANFLGGAMRLVPALAEAALQTHVAEPLKTDLLSAARGVFELVNSHMATATRIHVVERNRDVRRYVLFAFGGAGPVHAYHVAQTLGIAEVVVPPGAGVGSAIGLIDAPLAVEVARSHVVRLERLDPGAGAARPGPGAPGCRSPSPLRARARLAAARLAPSSSRRSRRSFPARFTTGTRSSRGTREPARR
jgi:N-methylhydantoinase A